MYSKMKLMAAAVAAVTAVSVAAPALAAPPWARGDGNQGRFEARHQWQTRFGDLSDSMWAMANIERAYQLNLMVGVGEGRFNPHAPITREQAIITAIRLMGLESQAKAQTNIDLHFTDANRVAPWAAGYVAVAVEKNILPPAGDGELRPAEPASRLWASVLLVKALGYDAEAQSKMSTPLTFKDADEIPANLVGYVAAAVDHKLVTGYEDGTFKPNKSVTRAEMAALLGRSEGQEADQGNRAGEIEGTIQAVDATAGTVTVQGAHGTISASLTTDAAIFVNGQAAQLSAVQTGMNVWVKLNADANITLLDAKSPDAAQTGSSTTQTQTVTGTVTAVTAAQGSVLGTITLQPASGSAVTASVAPAAVVTVAGATSTLAGVHTGDTAQAQVIAGIVVSLAVTPATSSTTTTTTGTTGSTGTN